MHHSRPALIRYFTLAALVLTLGGCSSGPNLSPVNPAGVDFSGTWLIDFSDSDAVPDLRNRTGGKSVRRSNRPLTQEALRLTDGSGLAFVVHDFQVLRADKIDIEMNRDSMGIRYYPGVYRDISWGERQRGLWEVNAGWEDDVLVIISEARNLEVVERIQAQGRGRLRINVAIEADGEEIAFDRFFSRQR